MPYGFKLLSKTIPRVFSLWCLSQIQKHIWFTLFSFSKLPVDGKLKIIGKIRHIAGKNFNVAINFQIGFQPVNFNFLEDRNQMRRCLNSGSGALQEPLSKTKQMKRQQHVPGIRVHSSDETFLEHKKPLSYHLSIDPPDSKHALRLKKKNHHFIQLSFKNC